MGGFIEPSSEPERDSNRIPIMVGLVLVVVVVAAITFFSRANPKNATVVDPYAASLKLSDLKMSAAENFVGASVTYLDGTVTNAGASTVAHAVVRVTFKNSLGEVAQEEQVPLHVLRSTGPAVDAVDLSIAPLAPGQSDKFRVTFEHVSSDWNQEYPQIVVTDVGLK